MQGLLKYDYADPDATGTAHANIDEILADNKAQTAFDIGSIGPTPWLETAEGQQTMLDMVTGSPGSAIGRVSKAAVTGGQLTLKAMKNLLKKGKPKIGSPEHQLDQIDRQLQIMRSMRPDKQTLKQWNKLKNKRLKLLKDDAMDISPGSSHDRINQITWDNEVNASRLAREKALDKHKIPHQRGIPSQPEEPLPLMDSVSELLHAIRFRKN